MTIFSKGTPITEQRVFPAGAFGVQYNQITVPLGELWEIESFKTTLNVGGSVTDRVVSGILFKDEVGTIIGQTAGTSAFNGASAPISFDYHLYNSTDFVMPTSTATSIFRTLTKPKELFPGYKIELPIVVIDNDQFTGDQWLASTIIIKKFILPADL